MNGEVRRPSPSPPLPFLPSLSTPSLPPLSQQHLQLSPWLSLPGSLSPSHAGPRVFPVPGQGTLLPWPLRRREGGLPPSPTAQPGPGRGRAAAAAVWERRGGARKRPKGGHRGPPKPPRCRPVPTPSAGFSPRPLADDLFGPLYRLPLQVRRRHKEASKAALKRQLGQSGRERESRAPLYSRKLSPPRPQPPKVQ